MNKFFIATALMLACVCTFAQPISLSIRDIEAVKKALSTSTKAYDKFHNTVALNLLSKEYTSFDEIKTMVYAEADKHFTQTNKWKNETAANMTKIICQEYVQFRSDAFAFAKKTPSSFDVAMYYRWDSGLSSDDLYKALFTALTNNIDKVSSKLCTEVVEKLITLGAKSTTIKTQKQDLQMLNRILSPRVLKDKASWEPVCSSIRTAIDTY